MLRPKDTFPLTCNDGNKQTRYETKKGLDHFTVVCSVSWPFNGSEAGVDLVLMQTSLLLLCQTSSSDAN